MPFRPSPYLAAGGAGGRQQADRDAGGPAAGNGIGNGNGNGRIGTPPTDGAENGQAVPDTRIGRIAV
jgi:hypothetical protein